MGKKRIKYGELTKSILSHLVESILAGCEAGMRHNRSYGLWELIDDIGEIFKAGEKLSRRKKRTYSVIRRLEKDKIVDLKREGERVFVYLKDINHPKVLKYSIKSLLDLKLKKKNWNKKWVIVFFDVPEEQRNKRDYLRRFLKEIGFYSYQKSVYVFPYECKKEIDLVKRIVASGKYLKYVVADYIEDEDKIKKYFNLS